MANTNVLLREDVENLGARGEIVRVKAGYARNYLLPRKIAVQATTGNMKQIEGERKALAKREAHDRAGAEAQAAQLRTLSLSFERKVGEHGILYGSVTSMDIAEALRAQGYEIDRRKLQLREPIKETGDFTVNLRLHRDVTVELPVKVTAEGGAATADTAAAAPAEAEAAAPIVAAESETDAAVAETADESGE